jgi:ComEC/Rec2-related protein
MFKIIIAYLLGIIVEANFGADIFLFFVVFCFCVIGYSISSFYKGHIKDTRIFIKDIGKISFILIVFSLSCLYTKAELETVSYIHLPQSIYEIEGSVVSMKQQNTTQELLVRVSKLTDLGNNTSLVLTPEYLTVYVSPLTEYQLFDYLNITGEINYKNWQNYYEEKPLFFSYEFMKLSENSFYTVSYPKHIERKSYVPNFYETVQIKFHALSEELKNKIPTHMSEPYAAIAQGISLGEQDNLQKDIKDIFKDSGLIHILVLSGANVVFVISLLWYFLKRIRNKFIKISSAIIASWLFILITGFTAPSARAGVMASTNILGEFFSKNVNAVHSLFFSLFILTIINPLSLIYSPSLHLSFLACFGLYIIAPKIELLIKNKFAIKHNFLIFLTATFVAIFLTVTPYLLALVGTSSLFGTVLTFLAEPFIMLTTILSFLIIVSSYLNFYLASFFGIINTLSTKIILLLAEFGAKNLPQISFQIGSLGLIIYYIFLFVLFSKSLEGEVREWYTFRK